MSKLLDRLPRFLTGRPELTVTERDGLTWVSDGKHKLAIVTAKRLNLYKRGIPYRLQRLSNHYRVDTLNIRHGDHVVNFGANIGELALSMIQRGAKVTAIEPDPTTLRCLRANVSDAGVTLLPFGLWDSDRDLTFYESPAEADTSAINQFGNAVTLPARRLDSLLADVPGRIRLLVGDAEGAEPEVLRGASGVLDRIDYVAIDCGPERHGYETVEECSAILRQARFRVARVKDRVLGQHPSLAA